MPADQPRSPAPLFGVLALLIALVAALAQAAQWAWLCDDAFLSFRYAEHLAEGFGLVFNPGEPVEGYTNFLWTVLLAGGMAVGAAPEALSVSLGLLSFAGVAGVLAWAGRRMAGVDRWWLPLAALAWLGVRHARVFATSGLETSLFALLLVSGAVAAIEARARAHWLGLGLLAALAALTRPEGGLLVLTAILAAVAAGPRRREAVLAVLAPLLALLGPWLAWKWSFYGDLLPNTWHAKAGGGARWEQGARYLWIYLRTWPLVAAGLVAAVALALSRLRRHDRDWLDLPAGWQGARAPLVLAALTAPYALHVVRVGGDFMFARFCLPWTPLALLAVELAAQRVPRSRERAVLAALLVAATALAPHPPELDPDTGEPWHGITAQRAWYPAAQVDEARRQGAVIAEKTAGIDLRVAFYGTQAMLMYYGDVPWAVEAHVGLTDRELARVPPASDADIGHGVKASLSWLQDRGVDLTFDYRLQQPKSRLTRVDFGEGVTARLLSYRPHVVSALRARGVEVFDLEAFLDRYIAQMDEMDDARVALDFASFQQFYFQHADDPAREAAFAERLSRARPDPR